ncbi:hypothetical protein ACFORH_39085 [Amycolatopsis roodepoortensis]|uniref:Uncharacterized protein n=1 Tax=Amycolatopsis roodepoortensis TaxID=700274 RepID=A0ABR9LIK0_9PSEU|nr:hypothetical protein [Amycolatopsis roodepoortensis]MBE1580520.1 hypothetical protein [Amycolatopsis roodepoortensis]
MPAVHKPKVDYGPVQLRKHLGIAEWQFNALLRHGHLPPSTNGRWLAEVVDELQARLPEALAAIGTQPPLGASRCAQLAAEWLDLDVDGPDIEELAERGLLAPAADYLGKTIEYKGWPLFDVLQVREVVESERAVVEDLVAERTAWIASSRGWREVRDELGWSFEEMLRVMRERGIVPGRFKRIANADAQALLGDEDLDQSVRGARLVGGREAARLAELRPVDFRYCRAAGWIAPASSMEVKVSRGKWVDVPLFRVADVEALVVTLAEMPGVDLEALRGLGERVASPLRELVALPTSRGVFVRGFAADLGTRHGVEVEAVYSDRRDRWTLSWTPNADGEPTVEAVRKAIVDDADLRPYARQIDLNVVDEA